MGRAASRAADLLSSLCPCRGLMLWSSMISYNEAMLGLVRKKLVIVVLLAVSFAAGFAIGVSMWEGEPATEEKSKSGEPAIHAT